MGTSLELTDIQDAARFVHYGLCPSEQTEEESEYTDLLRRYRNEPDFRAATHQVAHGFRLRVLAVDALGVVLAPEDDSAFALRTAADYRPGGHKNAEDRLIDGLIYVAILATVFPRAADLDAATNRVRLPITVVEVDRTLRDLCERIAAEACDEADAPSAEVTVGLREAWRVYQARPEVAATGDERAYQRATYTRIQNAFKVLISQGAFWRSRSGEDAYHATWRYHVLVQEFSADQLANAIRGLYHPAVAGTRTTARLAMSPATSANPKEDL